MSVKLQIQNDIYASEVIIYYKLHVCAYVHRVYTK